MEARNRFSCMDVVSFFFQKHSSLPPFPMKYQIPSDFVFSTLLNSAVVDAVFLSVL
jgi:hypothetical protein